MILSTISLHIPAKHVFDHEDRPAILQSLCLLQLMKRSTYSMKPTTRSYQIDNLREKRKTLTWCKWLKEIISYALVEKETGRKLPRTSCTWHFTRAIGISENNFTNSINHWINKVEQGNKTWSRCLRNDEWVDTRC